MLKEKREYYNENAEIIKFPKFRVLDTFEVSQCKENIKAIWGLNFEARATNLIDEIERTSSLVKNFRADDNNFNFKNMLKLHDINPDNEIAIIWLFSGKIDEISLDSFCEFFDDIWYPQADDLCLFDLSYRWLSLISHHGAISLMKTESKLSLSTKVKQ